MNDENRADTPQTDAAVGAPVVRGVRRTRGDIDPAEWASHADECVHCHKHKRQRGVTRWLDGRTKPARAGWYERLFTDGVFRHYWNGKVWAALRNGQPHWRQVGDYPCWRGLTCTAFMSPSRYPVARAPNVGTKRYEASA
jgi:hypothetical protein